LGFAGETALYSLFPVSTLSAYVLPGIPCSAEEDW
jgi:hypothetical protein